MTGSKRFCKNQNTSAASRPRRVLQSLRDYLTRAISILILTLLVGACLWLHSPIHNVTTYASLRLPSISTSWPVLQESSDSPTKEPSPAATPSEPQGTVDPIEDLDAPISKSRSATVLPEWVKQGNFVDQGTEYCLVQTPESIDWATAKASLDKKIIETVHRKLDEHFGETTPKIINSVQSLENWLASDRVHAQVIYTELNDELASELGQTLEKSYRYYAQLRLDDSFYDWAHQQREQRLVLSRVHQMGLMGGFLISVLAISFGFLRLNHQTRGFYRGRLQFLAFLGFLVLLLVVGNFAETIVWM